ncbi:hypothetical protein PGB90_006235 [Kerria lacca]
MKLNSSTVIVGNKVVLVPYKKIHVPKYHKWMQRKDLQEATASEPLSEEEEYHMQNTWFLDEDKCTFIILDKKIINSTNNEIDAMIGDVNLYLSNIDGKKIAECGIMIAENSARGQGKGFEALALMLKYGCEVLNVQKFEAKINLSNYVSLNLFKKIGFKLIDKNIFLEAILVNEVQEEYKKWLNEVTNGLSIISYDELLRCNLNS